MSIRKAYDRLLANAFFYLGWMTLVGHAIAAGMAAIMGEGLDIVLIFVAGSFGGGLSMLLGRWWRRKLAEADEG